MRKKPIKRATGVSYIGIDFSILSPGISIKYDDEHITHAFDMSDFKDKHPLIRWDLLTDRIVRFINRYTCLASSYIMIEDYAAGGKGKTNDIAEACGLLKYKLFINGVKIENFKLCSIQHLKMFIAGKGNAQKELMLKEIYKQYGYDTNDNNAADAYGLLMVCLCYFIDDELNKKTKEKQEIIQRIKVYNGDDKK